MAQHDPLRGSQFRSLAPTRFHWSSTGCPPTSSPAFLYLSAAANLGRGTAHPLASVEIRSGDIPATDGFHFHPKQSPRTGTALWPLAGLAYPVLPLQSIEPSRIEEAAPSLLAMPLVLSSASRPVGRTYTSSSSSGIFRTECVHGFSGTKNDGHGPNASREVTAQHPGGRRHGTWSLRMTAGDVDLYRIIKLVNDDCRKDLHWHQLAAGASMLLGHASAWRGLIKLDGQYCTLPARHGQARVGECGRGRGLVEYSSQAIIAKRALIYRLLALDWTGHVSRVRGALYSRWPTGRCSFPSARLFRDNTDARDACTGYTGSKRWQRLVFVPDETHAVHCSG